LAAESSLHPACRPANKPFVISGFDHNCSESALIFDRKCGKTALEFILPADAATIPPISGALPDASAPGRPSEAHFPHLRPGK